MWNSNYIKKGWNSGLNIVKNIRIEVNYKIMLVCKEIQKKVKTNEFSIVCKGEYTKQGFYISDVYEVPLQEVGTSDVDYNNQDMERLRQEGFNTVIHSHPFSNGRGVFSGTDDQKLNSTFDCSVLFNKNGFVLGCLSFKKDDSVFIFETENIRTVVEEEVTVEAIGNITERSSVVTYVKPAKSKNVIKKKLTKKIKSNKKIKGNKKKQKQKKKKQNKGNIKQIDALVPNYAKKCIMYDANYCVSCMDCEIMAEFKNPSMEDIYV